MEERLEKALEFANYRQTLNNQLQNTRIRAEGLLTLAKSGGTFKVGQELICFLDYLIRTDLETAVVLDANNVPIQIDNLPAFLKEVTARYHDVTNSYSKEYQEIRKARNVKSILSLKESE